MHYTARVLGQPTVAVLCAVLTATVAAPAESPSRDAAARQAAELTHAKRYAEAAEAYARAFEETGAPVHLYSQAMSLRRAGSCPEAIGVFQRFIEQAPPEPDVEAARTQIEECEALIERSKPEPEPEPAAPPPPTPPRTEPEPALPARWTRDPWGGVLVAVGGVTAIAGGGLLVIANASSTSRPGETERTHAERETEVRNTSIAGFSLLGVGAACIVGGVVRYVVYARRGRTPRSEGGALTWRF